jgi:hypothetical protein
MFRIEPQGAVGIIDESRVSVALARAFSPTAFPRLTPWAITLPPLAGLSNTLDRFFDTF